MKNVRLNDVSTVKRVLYILWYLAQRPQFYFLQCKELTFLFIHLGANNSFTARALYPYVNGETQYPQIHHFGITSVINGQ